MTVTIYVICMVLPCSRLIAQNCGVTWLWLKQSSTNLCALQDLQKGTKILAADGAVIEVLKLEVQKTNKLVDLERLGRIINCTVETISEEVREVKFRLQHSKVRWVLLPCNSAWLPFRQGLTRRFPSRPPRTTASWCHQMPQRRPSKWQWEVGFCATTVQPRRSLERGSTLQLGQIQWCLFWDAAFWCSWSTHSKVFNINCILYIQNLLYLVARLTIRDHPSVLGMPQS